MRLSNRIFTVRYECFNAGLYLMKEGDIRRRLIINDKAVQEHLKKPPRSDWPCENYQLFDIATVKTDTLVRFKSIYNNLPAELKQKALPSSPIILSQCDDITPRTGTLVSYGHYGVNQEYAIDLIDQYTGELIRIQGLYLEQGLLASGAARNELIKIQAIRQNNVVLSETQYNPDGSSSELNTEEPVIHYQINKLENSNVQQTNSARKCRQETGTTLYRRPETVHGS